MYTRITKSGGRQSLQLVESFRNNSGKVRTRVVANLGRLDQITPERIDPLINGLNRAVGRAENTASEVVQEAGLSFGDVFALHELWRDLGIDTALKRALRSSRRELDAEALIRAMVFNRLCDRSSKLGCLPWLETVAMPARPEKVTPQHLADHGGPDGSCGSDRERFGQAHPPLGRPRPGDRVLRPDNRADPR